MRSWRYLKDLLKVLTLLVSVDLSSSVRPFTRLCLGVVLFLAEIPRFSSEMTSVSELTRADAWKVFESEWCGDIITAVTRSIAMGYRFKTKVSLRTMICSNLNEKKA